MIFYLNRLCLFLVFFSLFFLKSSKIQAQTKPNLCQNNLTLAYYELATDWIYICQESDQLFLLKTPKNDFNSIQKISASGSFPTYAAIEGDLSDSESKIYNISPFFFQIVESSIITKIQPVLRTINPSLNLEISQMSGDIKNKAMEICQNYQPVQVFETDNNYIYICIEVDDNNTNAIDLIYVQQNKSDSNFNSEVRLNAQLIANFNYETITKNNFKYVISYKGLEIYQNGIKIKEESIKNLYLVASDQTKEGY